MSFIEVKNLNKTFKVNTRNSGLINAFKNLFIRKYKLVKAVSDISFKIKKGEIVAYIGPNGAGKSTTIKNVKNIGVVFGQKSQLWWDIPVEDSFLLLKDIYKIKDNDYKKIRDELCNLLDLSELLKTPVRQLSLGQRMRCEIAASLLHNPKILFLDEPTIGLDAVGKVAIRKFIKEINKKRKVTIILTSHDMSDIEALTNRVIVIGHGKKLYDGTLNDIKKKFSNDKKLEIIYHDLRTIPKIKGVKTLEHKKNKVILKVNMDNNTISYVINRYSQACEIDDVNILSDNIDEIIIKLYKDYDI